MKRDMTLLLKAAEEFEKGSNPFCTEWLSAHGVTLDECFTLSERIALILKGYLASTRDDQIKIGALGAVYGVEGVDLEVMRAEVEKSHALKKLKKLKA